MCCQVEDGMLTDYEGTYARFLEKNESEAGKMAVKEQKKKELEKSQIKAKSKVTPYSVTPQYIHEDHL